MIWVKRTVGGYTPRKIAVGEDGGLYMVGGFRATITIGSQSGAEDILLIKFDTNRNVQWYKQSDKTQYRFIK